MNAVQAALTTASSDATTILAAVTTAVTASADLDPAQLGSVDASSIVVPTAPIAMTARNPDVTPAPPSAEDDGSLKSGLSWVGMALVAGSFAV
jgi:glyoxylate carboligase